MPPVSLADFKKQGGTLTGREERFDGFEGEPKAIGGALSASNHHHHAGGSTGNYSGVGNPNTTDSGYGSGTTGSSYSPNTPVKKPGLLDRLNPLKDTDGDGKKGVLE